MVIGKRIGDVMSLITLYKQGKEEVRKLNSIQIPRNINIKSTLFTILFLIIIGLPFIIILGSMITVFSPVRIMYWLTMIFICILLPFLMALSSIFNMYLLKNYLEENEEIQKINIKAIFVKDLLNPISFFVGVIICILICYMAM